MANKKTMLLNKINRIKRGGLDETKSRARRNRMRNYLKEEDAKQEIKERA